MSKQVKKRKQREYDLARIYYVEQGLTAKGIAAKLNVQEKTVGNWVNENDEAWKKERLARETGPNTLLNALYTALEAAALKMAKLESGEKVEGEDLNSIADRISKINKSIDNAKKDTKPSLRIYIHCIETFMKALKADNPKLYIDLIDFQERHITRMAEELS